jgi:hypothetical protein
VRLIDFGQARTVGDKADDDSDGDEEEEEEEEEEEHVYLDELLGDDDEDAQK